MNIQEHLDKVNSLKQQIEKLNTELVEHLKTSTDLSLDERWDLYCSLESFLPVASFIQDLETLHRDVVGYDHLDHVDCLRINSSGYFIMFKMSGSFYKVSKQSYYEILENLKAK